MNKLSFTIIFSSISAILFFSGFFLLVNNAWPKYQEISLASKNMAVKKAELQREREVFSSLTETKRKLDQYETELSKIDSALPASLSVPDVLDFLQKASSQSGLVLKGMGAPSISPSEISPQIKEIQIALSLQGTYQSLKDFLSVISKSAKIIEPEIINFSSPGKGNTFDFGVSVKTFSY